MYVRVHTCMFCGPAAVYPKHTKCVSRPGTVDGKWRVSMLTLSIPINHNSPFKSTGRGASFSTPLLSTIYWSAASPISRLITRLNDNKRVSVVKTQTLSEFLCSFHTIKMTAKQDSVDFFFCVCLKIPFSNGEWLTPSRQRQFYHPIIILVLPAELIII